MIEIDHLVVACPTLEVGRAWCEAMFGVAAQPGGRHPLMGTHNLLLALASPRHPRAYLELIAIDPEAQAPAQPRWFDLDAPALQAAIRAEPRLVHWVARCNDIEAIAGALGRDGDDPGPIVAVERMTPRGLLRWRMTVPIDGHRPCVGAMPLWIQWSSGHPTDVLPASGVAIESLQVGGLAPALAGHVRQVAACTATDSALRAFLIGPRGPVVLTASGLLSA